MKKKKKAAQKSRDPRETLRIDTVQKVSFRTNSSVDGEGFTQNLSEKGCCLFLDQEIPVGSLIQITFDRLGNDQHEVKVLGRVIWQKNYLSGIKFFPNISV